jgi:hypothetical protein
MVLYVCETWSLILREEHRLRVLKNRVLRRLFEPKREVDENYILRSFLTSTPFCTLHQIYLGRSSQGG